MVGRREGEGIWSVLAGEEGVALFGVDTVETGRGETTCRLGETVERGIWIRVEDEESDLEWLVLELAVPPEALLDLCVCLCDDEVSVLGRSVGVSGRGCSESIALEAPEVLRLADRTRVSFGAG